MTANPNTARVVVPLEPTPKMIDAGARVIREYEDLPQMTDLSSARDFIARNWVGTIWPAMIEAAPASPAVGLEEAVGLREALRDLSSAASKVFNKLANGRYATRGELQNILRGPIDKAQAAFLARMDPKP